MEVPSVLQNFHEDHQISKYRNFLDKNPKNVYHQTIVANSSGKNITFTVNAPGPNAVLDATKVKLRCKIRTTFPDANGVNQKLCYSPSTNLVSKIAARYNCLQNAMSSFTVSINGASKTYRATDYTNQYKYWQDCNYDRDYIEGGGPSRLLDVQTTQILNDDVNFSTRWMNFVDKIPGSNFKTDFTADPANTPASNYDLTFTQKLDSFPPFWSGNRTELTGQMSHCIPNIQNMNLTINFLPDESFEAAVFELGKTIPTHHGSSVAIPNWQANVGVKCEIVEKPELLLTWYNLEEDQIPRLSTLPVWSVNVDTQRSGNNASMLNNSGSLSLESNYLRLTESPAYMMIYAQVSRNNSTAPSGFNLFVSTDNGVSDISVQRDENPRLDNFNITINTDSGVISTDVGSDQLYDLTMANCHAFPYSYQEWLKHRCVVILSSAQLSALGIPQGVMNSGANIKVRCTAHSPTQGFLQLQDSAKEIQLHTLMFNNAEYLEITQDRAVFQKQTLNPDMVSNDRIGSGMAVAGSLPVAGYSKRF